MNAILVPAPPLADLQASTVPFDWKAWSQEKTEWERKLRPPHKVFGPTLILCESINPGMWEACHWAPGSMDVVWVCEGADLRAVHREFQRHLRECAI